ncbi:MAG: glycosyltransferase family 2 protein [Candidatus Helarchaeota archaeon]|nr:glycosyltransferase family 2 protein [Candidatus Helarchaeota archaeon]
MVVFLCSLTFFICAFFFFRIVFDVVLYINTICILIALFYAILLGLIPFFLKREPKEIPQESPEISIIIPVFNDGEVLERTLKNLLKLSYPGFEILVVYSEKSTDRTEEVALEFAQKYDHIQAFPENVSRGFALNLGIDNAKNEFLLFLDSDTIIFDGFIERALSYFSDENIKLVSSVFLGLNTTQNIVTMMGWSMMANMNFYAVGTNKYVRDINFTGFGGMWRKNALIECGKFALNTPSDEAEITHRVLTDFPKWKGIYDENLFCYQYYPADFKSLYIQQIHWMTGKLRYALGAIRKMSGMSLIQKFIFLSAIFMIIIFPLFIWFSMGMSFVQFFVNFFQPNISFGGGIFFFILGIVSALFAFTTLFIFTYSKHRGKSRVFLSRKFILGGIFFIMFICGIFYAVIALNALKEVVSKKKKREIFIKMDKSELKDDDLLMDSST